MRPDPHGTRKHTPLLRALVLLLTALLSTPSVAQHHLDAAIVNETTSDTNRITVLVRLHHDAPTVINVQGRAILPSGWRALTPLPQLTLHPEEMIVVPILLASDRTAPAGAHTGMLEFRTDTGTMNARVAIHLTIPERRRVRITPIEAPSFLIEGAPHVRLHVSNDGNVEEPIQLTSNEGTMLAPTVVTLSPGDHAVVEAWRDPPADANAHTPILITVNAHATGLPTQTFEHAITQVPIQLDPSAAEHHLPITIRVAQPLDILQATPQRSGVTTIRAGGELRDGSDQRLDVVASVGATDASAPWHVTFTHDGGAIRIGTPPYTLLDGLDATEGPGLQVQQRYTLSRDAHLGLHAHLHLDPATHDHAASTPVFGARIDLHASHAVRGTIAWQHHPGGMRAGVDLHLAGTLMPTAGLRVTANLEGRLMATTTRTHLHGTLSARLQHPHAYAEFAHQAMPITPTSADRQEAQMHARARLDVAALLGLESDAIEQLRAYVDIYASHAPSPRLDAAAPPAPDSEQRTEARLEARVSGSLLAVRFLEAEHREPGAERATAERTIAVNASTPISNDVHLHHEAFWGQRTDATETASEDVAERYLGYELRARLNLHEATVTPHVRAALDLRSGNLYEASAGIGWRTLQREPVQVTTHLGVEVRRGATVMWTLGARLRAPMGSGRGLLITPHLTFDGGGLADLSVDANLELARATVGTLALHAEVRYSHVAPTRWTTRSRLDLQSDTLPLVLGVELLRDANGTQGSLDALLATDLGEHQTLLAELEASFAPQATPHTQLTLTYERTFALPLGPRTTTHPVAGRVTWHDGTPISHVVVSLAGQHVATNAEGRFRFPAIAHGTHVLTVEPSSLPQGTRVEPTHVRLDVEPTHPPSPTSLVAFAPAVLSGRIAFAPPDEIDAAPYEHAAGTSAGRFAGAPPIKRATDRTLRVVRYGSGSLDDDAKQVAHLTLRLVQGSTMREVTTESDGTFRVTGLTPGAWRIDADPRTLPPNVVLPDLPHTLTLHEGQEANVLLRLHPAPRVTNLQEGGTLTVP